MKVSAHSFLVQKKKKLKYPCFFRVATPQRCFVRCHMQSTAGVGPQVSVVFLFSPGDIIKTCPKPFFKGPCALWQRYLGPMNILCCMFNAGSSCHENMFHLANLIKAWCLPLLLVSRATLCCPEETETIWNHSVCVIFKLLAFAMATCYQG